jgi:prepilin peptidase CpaA
MDPIRLVLIICVVAYTSLAGLVDWRTRRLPNWMTVSALAAALLFHIVTGFLQDGLAGVGGQLLFSLGGFATGFGILFVLWAMGGGGGGDVKFMGALGAWLGAKLTLQVFLVGAVVIVIGSVFMLATEGMRMGVHKAKDRYLSSDRSTSEARVKRRLLPYGVSAMFATWVVLAVSELVQRSS